MSNLSFSLTEAAAVVAGLGDTAAAFAALDESVLTAAVRSIAALRHDVDRYAALAAAELAHRSRHELGHSGLAQKTGFVSPVAMLQSVAQLSKQEATRLMETGRMLAEAEFSLAAGLDPALGSSSDFGPSSESSLDSADATAPLHPAGCLWRGRLAQAVTDATLSVDAADAIRRVISDTIGDIPDPVLDDAVAELIAVAPGLNPEQLYWRARQLRDQIDIEGIEAREKQQHDLRSVRTWWDPVGMHCGSWRLAPEDGALVAEAFAQILSPRRGGPRFVDPEARATAEDLVNDARSDEQIAADAFVGMVRLATDADPGTMFGHRRPAVRVLITADRLNERATAGRSTDDASAAPVTTGAAPDVIAPHTPTAVSATGTVTATATPTASVTATPAASAIPTATATATASVSATPTATPTAFDIPIATATATPTESATVTPIATPTPIASAIPTVPLSASATAPATVSTLHGYLEGRTDVFSAATVERLLCDTGTISIGFDTDGACMNVGREHRLFTTRQRIGLAARDGGCLFPGCDRPPSYCEAHHINPWVAKKGKTDIADGILFCRRHHLLIHNQHWDVLRDGATYWLKPPRTIDPHQTLIPMPTKSTAMTSITTQKRRA